jgi:hypothetical protein
MMQQLQQNRVSGFLSRYTYVIIALALIAGISIGYYLSQYNKYTKDSSISKVPTIQFLITDGEQTKAWNNVTLNEGDSVAKILSRISDIENIDLTWDNESKDQNIVQIMNKYSESGVWAYYVNNATPQPAIGRFYPKKGDVISIIYTNNKP